LAFGGNEHPKICYMLRGVQDPQSDTVAILVVVENHARLIFVTFLNVRMAEQNAEHLYIAGSRR
jgi:hypothetical protein